MAARCSELGEGLIIRGYRESFEVMGLFFFFLIVIFFRFRGRERQRVKTKK